MNRSFIMTLHPKSLRGPRGSRDPGWKASETCSLESKFSIFWEGLGVAVCSVGTAGSDDLSQGIPRGWISEQ